MNRKFNLAIVALIGVGLFALPATMALFAGQHSFYNIDATGNQVPCVKCHGDVKAELGSNAGTMPNTAGPHATFECEYCHRIEAGSASGDNAYGRIQYSVGGHGAPGASVYLVMSVKDMEAGNFPAEISGTETAASIVNLSTLSGEPMGAFALSPCLDSGGATICGNASAVLPSEAPNRRIYPTYSTTTGDPLDTNPATQNTGLNVNAVTFSPTNGVNLTGAGSKAVNPGTEYHAASLVSCMECHGGEEPMGHYSRVVDGTDSANQCQYCHYGPSGSARWTDLAAGGFGLTGDAADTGAKEAHNDWVKTDDGISTFGGPNGEANNNACVACHTHVAVDITFQKAYALTFDATALSNGTWDVSEATAEGDVTITVYGNGSGETFATGDKVYNWTQPAQLYIDGNQTNPILNGLVNDVSDGETALTT